VTTLYLASSWRSPGRYAFLHDASLSIGLLCSYEYYGEASSKLMQHAPGVRQWVLDSGAYSAFATGKEIKIDDYIDFCKAMRDTARPPHTIFALDVIGDWRASLRNTEAMWKAGVEAVPAYHAGEPEAVLLGIARDYPKIAIGGTIMAHGGARPTSVRKRFFEQCFARVWPKKIHGFGVSTESLIFAVPWHSADATSWEMGPGRFGEWQAYEGLQGRARGDLRAEVRWYMDLEARARARWAPQMKELG
jgi:hypothetical protein